MSHFELWLKAYEENRKDILKELRTYRQTIKNTSEKLPKNLLRQVTPGHHNLPGPHAFVDGGEGIRDLLGAAAYAVRGSALIIDDVDKQKGRFARNIDIGVLPHDDHTKDRVELRREILEVDAATTAINDHNAKTLFLDGSLYVKARRQPAPVEEYKAYRKKFAALLRTCKNKNIRLIGVSEDTKSKLLTHHLKTQYDVEFPIFLTDASILRMLAGKQTTFQTPFFTPQSLFEADEDLGRGFTVGFHTAYLQPTPLSLPLRIDIPDWDPNPQQLMDFTAYLTQGSRSYGYPVPLYLVHIDAHITPHQTDWSTEQLLMYIRKEDPDIADSILHINRRENRPKGKNQTEEKNSS
ncbi:NurA domain protein [uncultured archaeon]|nr:NurA domain protein [uncultured archaeon]